MLMTHGSPATSSPRAATSVAISKRTAPSRNACTPGWGLAAVQATGGSRKDYKSDLTPVPKTCRQTRVCPLVQLPLQENSKRSALDP